MGIPPVPPVPGDDSIISGKKSAFSKNVSGLSTIPIQQKNDQMNSNNNNLWGVYESNLIKEKVINNP